MPEEQNTEPQKRVSKSFIFSFIVVAAIIGILIFIMVKNASSNSGLRTTQFVEKMQDKSIQTLDIAEQSTVVELKGEYVEGSSPDKHKYTLKLSKTYYENAVFSCDLDGDGTKETLTLTQIINYRDAHANENDTFKLTTTNVYETTWWDEWGPTIILLGCATLLCFFLFGRLANSVGASNTKALDFNQSRARKIKNCKVRFTDVAGADEEKTELQEVVAYLKEPTRFTKFGAKLPKGILLVGSPGTGKTLLAKAVAGEAGVPFFTISGSDFVEMFVGVGAGRVRDMFKVAKENAPCLVFIDEIDAVGRQRGTGLGGGNDEREQTLNQLLVEMDGFNDNSGIIVMAATNRDDVLDPALLRAGRFDRKITVTLPDKKAREEIFKVHSRKKVIGPDVDFSQLAKRTVGFSGADIENIMNEAAILAVRRNKACIGVDEIDEAIDRRVAGPAKTSRSITGKEKEIIAFHEAGHAIIGIKYPHSDKVQKITIIPRGNTGGHVRTSPEDDKFVHTKNELIARIVGFLGGRASEEIFFDDVCSGASSDIQEATYLARLMVCELGMSPLGPIQYENNSGSVFLGRDYTNSQKNFSVETATKIDEEIRKIIEFAHEEAKKCIEANKADVELLAKTLIEHEQITGEEIDYLLENRHLKRDEAPADKPVDAPEEKPADDSKDEPVKEAEKPKKKVSEDK